MEATSQHRWELLHPFVHHYQHGGNNSQHCWSNIVGSCCIRLYTTANTHATTHNIVVPTMMGVVASLCTKLKLFVRFQTFRNNSQQDATTCNRVCKRPQYVTSNNVGNYEYMKIILGMLANNNASVCKGLCINVINGTRISKKFRLFRF